MPRDQTATGIDPATAPQTATRAGSAASTRAAPRATRCTTRACRAARPRGPAAPVAGGATLRFTAATGRTQRQTQPQPSHQLEVTQRKPPLPPIPVQVLVAVSQ